MNRLTSKIRRLLACVLILSAALGGLPSALAETQKAIVTADSVRVYRDAAQTTFYGSVKKYTVLTVAAVSGNTARVQLNGKTGYCATGSLALIDDVKKPASVTANTRVYLSPSGKDKSVAVKKGFQLNLVAVNGSKAMVEKNGNIGYMWAKYLRLDADAPAQETFTDADFEAVVKTGSVKVYEKPSADSKYLGSMKKGTTVEVQRYSASWAYVRLGSRYGYCAKSALEKKASPTPTATLSITYEEFPAVVSTKTLKVYASASTGSKLLGTLKSGRSVTVHAYDKTWARISLNGNYGYCLKSGLKKSVETPAPTAKPTAAPTPVPTAAPTVKPTATTAPASTDAIFSDDSLSNEQKVFAFITKRMNYTPAVACGIMANIYAESRFNPASVSSAGYSGICQWSQSRFAAIKSWCESRSYDPMSLEGQLNYLKYDLDSRNTVYHKALKAMGNTAQDAYDAGYYFCYYYERPSNKASKSDTRGIRARDVYWPKYGN
ncbi:MAG: phage tail tip lysozyme [Clostridia bacterium]|nr:phage tail tip lysozyme [Clostridia bacterium]